MKQSITFYVGPAFVAGMRQCVKQSGSPNRAKWIKEQLSVIIASQTGMTVEDLMADSPSRNRVTVEE